MSTNTKNLGRNSSRESSSSSNTLKSTTTTTTTNAESTLSQLGPMSIIPENDMKECVLGVEKILKYKFKNKKHLQEALTHSSCADSASYQRLEFVGDAVLGLAFANFVFLAYPTVDPGILSLIRAANISTENLARVAVRNGLHRYVRHNALPLDLKDTIEVCLVHELGTQEVTK